MNAVASNATSGISFMGVDPFSQVLTAVGLVAAVYFTMMFAEYVTKSFMAMWRDRVELFPNTYASGAKMYTAIQNPNNKNSKTVWLSDNQRSGVEFSYALFCYVSSETFSSGSQKLYHILHKGYGKPYPLMGPGIFAWGHKNCLRVFMNCFNTWDNWTDVENIPVDKWMHVVVSCKGNQLYVYINGNLKQKVTMSGNTPPYQNFGDVYAFSPRKMTLRTNTTVSLQDDPDFKGVQAPISTMEFDGSAKGYLSRVMYFSYALTYGEIQSLMNQGPSDVFEGVDLSISPYLADRWWTDKQA